MNAASDPPTGNAPGDDHPMRDWGGLGIAAVVILIGGYYLLRNTFGVSLPDLDWDRLWPVLVVALGVGALIRGGTGHSHRHRRDRQR